MALKPGPDDLICSARGCETPATQAVLWKNPMIHRGRHKTWLTCDEHTDLLRDYLAYRNFPLMVVPVDERDAHSNEF